jgi:hypothetical protein
MAKTNNYSDKLKDPRWQKKRLEIFERDEFSCVCCGSENNSLQVHHKIYIKGKEPWEYDNEYLITLCEDCHEKTTRVNDLIKIQLSRFNDIDELKSIDEILCSCSKLTPAGIDLVMDISEILVESNRPVFNAIQAFIHSYKQSIENENDPNYF